MSERTERKRARAPAQDIDLCWLYRDSAAECGQSSIHGAFEAMALAGPGTGSTDPAANRLVSREIVRGVGRLEELRESPVGRQRRILRFLAACTQSQQQVLELAYGLPKAVDAEARAKLGPWPDVAYRVPEARIAFDFQAPRGNTDGTRATKVPRPQRRIEPLGHRALEGDGRKAWHKAASTEVRWKEPETARMDFQRWLREEASPRTLGVVREQAAKLVLQAWEPFDAARRVWIIEERAKRAKEEEVAGRRHYRRATERLDEPEDLR